MSNFVNTVDSIGDEALTSSIINKSITDIRDNYVTTIGVFAFYKCTALTTVDFVSVTTIGEYAFNGCSALTTLILRSATMATLGNANAFSKTPIDSGTGYIYVPAALVDSYKAASNWSTYANQIRAIEDYPEFCDPYSWEAVAKHIELGDYATFYKVGDCVPMDLGSEGVVNMQIAAFDADTLADGSGKAPISWISKELLATTHRMNPALVDNGDGTYQEGTGAIGGWEHSEMRTYLTETVKPLIPETVRNAIKSVTKTQSFNQITGIGGEQTTTDDVWIPSGEEITGSDSLYYPLFKNTDTNRIKTKTNGSQNNWWCRNCVDMKTFCAISRIGKTYGGSANANNYVAIGFCT